MATVAAKTARYTLLAPTADIEVGKANLDRYGYTIHPDFVDAGAVRDLRARVDEQAELEREQGVATMSSEGHAGGDRHVGRADDAPAYQGVSFLPNKGRAFVDLMMHPLSALYSRHVFRDVPYNLATQSALILRKGAKQQVVHVDQQAWPFTTSIPVMLNIMLCLSDFDADMGATRILPGSHLGPPPEIGGAFLDAEELGMIPLLGKPGAALIWESRTWHCQGTHVSQKTRCSIGTVFAVHFAKPQDFYPAVIHDDVYEGLSEVEREMLGFKVAFEYGGRIGPRRPEDARCNTNARFPYIPELHRGGAQTAIANPGARVAIGETLPQLVESPV